MVSGSHQASPALHGNGQCVGDIRNVSTEFFRYFNIADPKAQTADHRMIMPSFFFSVNSCPVNILLYY
jgi:hypothetical protein